MNNTIKPNETPTQLGAINIFTLLQLIADSNGGSGYIYISRNQDSHKLGGVISCLTQVDPQHIHWHLETNGDVTRVWRRKEWNDSYEKSKLDTERKEKLYENEAKFQQNKSDYLALLRRVGLSEREAKEKYLQVSNKPEELAKCANVARQLLGEL